MKGIPKTVVIHRENVAECAAELGFPCVLKRPDSSFSRGVVKVASERELHEQHGADCAQQATIAAAGAAALLVAGRGATAGAGLALLVPLRGFEFPLAHRAAV